MSDALSDLAKGRYYLGEPHLEKKYTRFPMDCAKCRIEHGIIGTHIGPDENADCGSCIADAILKKVIE